MRRGLCKRWIFVIYVNERSSDGEQEGAQRSASRERLLGVRSTWAYPVAHNEVIKN